MAFPCRYDVHFTAGSSPPPLLLAYIYVQTAGEVGKKRGREREREEGSDVERKKQVSNLPFRRQSPCCSSVHIAGRSRSRRSVQPRAAGGVSPKTERAAVASHFNVIELSLANVFPYLGGGKSEEATEEQRRRGRGLLPPPPPSPFATVSDGEERKKRPPPPPQTRKVDWNHPAWLVGWLTTAGKGGPLGKSPFNGLNIQGEMGKLPSKLQSKFLKVSRKKGEREENYKNVQRRRKFLFSPPPCVCTADVASIMPRGCNTEEEETLPLLLQFSTNPPFPFPPRYFSAAPSNQLGSQRTQ